MYVTISKFDIYDRATDCPNGIISGDISRDCSLRYAVDVKIENPSDEVEAPNVTVQMWCKNSKKNLSVTNSASEGEYQLTMPSIRLKTSNSPIMRWRLMICFLLQKIRNDS
jgi:hypothetical protein